MGDAPCLIARTALYIVPCSAVNISSETVEEKKKVRAAMYISLGLWSHA